MRVAALFLGLMAGLFALLAPSALKVDLMTPFVEFWASTPSERLVATVVWYSIPALALLGGVLATVTPGFAALLLTAAAAGWIAVGLMLPNLFDYKLIGPASVAGLGALCALIAGELEVRRRRLARRRERVAISGFADLDESEREAVLRRDPLLSSRNEPPSVPHRAAPLAVENVSAVERPSRSGPRWQTLDATAKQAPGPVAWGEARSDVHEPEHQPQPVVEISAAHRAFRWDHSDAPSGQPLETRQPLPRLEPKQPEPIRRADPLRVDEQMLPEPKPERPVPQTEQPARTRRRGGVMAPVLAAFASVVILGALAAGGYLAYREGWIDRIVAMIPQQQTPAREAGDAVAAAPVVDPDAQPDVVAAPSAPGSGADTAPAVAAGVSAGAPIQAEIAAGTFADPFAYCEAVGTVDRVDKRYQGPVFTDAITGALSLPAGSSPDRVHWRCFRGAVLACTSYSGPVCDATPSLAEMRAFCAINREVALLMAPAGTWSCKAGQPLLPRGSSWPVDERGFLPSSWVVVSAS